MQLLYCTLLPRLYMLLPLLLRCCWAMEHRPRGRGLKLSHAPAWLFRVPKNADESVLLVLTLSLYPHRRFGGTFVACGRRNKLVPSVSWLYVGGAVLLALHYCEGPRQQYNSRSQFNPLPLFEACNRNTSLRDGFRVPFELSGASCYCPNMSQHFAC